MEINTTHTHTHVHTHHNTHRRGGRRREASSVENEFNFKARWQLPPHQTALTHLLGLMVRKNCDASLLKCQTSALNMSSLSSSRIDFWAGHARKKKSLSW